MSQSPFLESLFVLSSGDFLGFAKAKAKVKVKTKASYKKQRQLS